MNPLLEQLHDIEGLDLISAWPLASGWWMVIFLISFIFIAVVGYVLIRILFWRSWRGDTLRKLMELEKNLSEETSLLTAIYLSQYLRRIALKRHRRGDFAGLAGDAWLEWLAKNDPKKFDWKNKGKLLVDAPYAPWDSVFSTETLKDLIQAVKGWVR